MEPFLIYGFLIAARELHTHPKNTKVEYVRSEISKNSNSALTINMIIYESAEEHALPKDQEYAYVVRDSSHQRSKSPHPHRGIQAL